MSEDSPDLTVALTHGDRRCGGPADLSSPPLLSNLVEGSLIIVILCGSGVYRDNQGQSGLFVICHWVCVQSYHVFFLVSRSVQSLFRQLKTKAPDALIASHGDGTH